MKICVSSKGETPASDVDPRFGRSRGFVLFDGETKDVVYLDNETQRGLEQGAGILTAKMIVDAGSDALIAGQLGPKAARVLRKAGVRIYAADAGTVQEAIQALEAGRLKELDDEAVRPGPGKQGGRGMGGGGRGRQRP
jgi:predicted Fe-Mo cluster-binding NifX family protein